MAAETPISLDNVSYSFGKGARSELSTFNSHNLSSSSSLLSWLFLFLVR